MLKKALMAAQILSLLHTNNYIASSRYTAPRFMPNKVLSKSIAINLPPKTHEEKILVLLYALTTNNLNTIKYLMEHGIEPTLHFNLQEILRSRNLTIVTKPAEPTPPNMLFLQPRDIADLTIYEYKDKQIPLMYYAALKSTPDCVAYLLKNASFAVEWNSAADYVPTLTYLIMKKIEDPGVLYLFLKKTPEAERQLYLEAIVKHHSNNLELVATLLDKLEGSFNANILLLSAYPNNITIKLLVERFGADINAKVFNGLALLHKAIQDRNSHLVYKFLRLKADPNLCANSGLRPLDFVTGMSQGYAHNKSEIEQLLKAAGASEYYKCEYLCYNRMLSPYGKELTPEEQLKLIEQNGKLFDYTCS